MRAGLKLKAGALQYAIFISILIAIMVFAFMSLTLMQNKIKIRAGFYKRAIENVEKGFSYVERNQIPYNKTLTIIQGREKEDSILLKKLAWGAFDLVQVSSKVRNEYFKKSALIGGHQMKRTALHVQDKHRPIVLVGNTHIEGDVFLPEKGVKRGSIGGHSFYGNQLIYGSMYQSHQELPQLQNREEIMYYSRNILENRDVEVFDQFGLTGIRHSFFDRTLLINSLEALVLEDMVLKGNIVIHSESSITVSSNSLLEDVVLLAPKIIIEDMVNGNFQAIASRSIEVGKNCKLKYPSSLVLVDISESNEDILHPGQMVIDQNSEIKGVIVFLTETKELDVNPQIKINEDAIVSGEVYSEVNLELKGTVFGMVVTSGFVSSHKGAKYQNHVFNGQIIEDKLAQQYCGLTFERMNMGVAKWLY